MPGQMAGFGTQNSALSNETSGTSSDTLHYRDRKVCIFQFLMPHEVPFLNDILQRCYTFHLEVWTVDKLIQHPYTSGMLDIVGRAGAS